METERQTTIDTLSDCYSQGYIDADEFELRLEKAYSATGVSDLRPILSGLPELYREALADPSALIDADSGQQIRNILSERHMAGDWLTHRVVKCTSVASELHLDFRAGSLPPGRTRIHLFGLMTEIKVTLPQDVKLILDVNPILSEVSTKKTKGRLNPDSTRELQISGTVVMTELTVKAEDSR